MHALLSLVGNPIQQFTAAETGGLWSGDGIIDPSGVFDPSVAAIGNNNKAVVGVAPGAQVVRAFLFCESLFFDISSHQRAHSIFIFA